MMEPIKIKEIVKAVQGRLLCGEPDAEITSVSTNSKEVEAGGLFVPIIGERVDAHRFIKDAFFSGAAAAFTSREETDFVPSGAYIQVEDTQKALQDFAAYYRSLFSIPIIGITGSVGKTTTKEMVAAALSGKYKVLKTAGNMNSQIGLPLMMFQINKVTEIAVIEMGISEEGEMSRLVKIAKPETVIMTNIGVSHIAQLGSRENIRKEKLNIINEFKEGGTLYLNGEDALLSQIGKDSSVEVSEDTKEALLRTSFVYYGTGKECTLRGQNISYELEETHFTVGEEEIVLSVLEMHNVLNALAALGVSRQYGADLECAKKGLRNYRPISGRGQIYEKNGIRIIDDTYNASPDSMKSGINVLLNLEGRNRRIAVLADILELGEKSGEYHFEIGEYIGKAGSKNGQVDILVTIGKEAAAIGEGVLSCQDFTRVERFETNQEAAEFLKGILKSGDGILVKGSRGMHTEEIIKALEKL